VKRGFGRNQWLRSSVALNSQLWVTTPAFLARRDSLFYRRTI